MTAAELWQAEANPAGRHHHPCCEALHTAHGSCTCTAVEVRLSLSQLIDLIAVDEVPLEQDGAA